jgi:PKD repeat protein
MRALLIALFISPATASAYTISQSINQSLDGQDISFNFTGLPTASSSVTLTVGLQGDYSYGDLSNPEGSQNYADGNFLGTFVPANDIGGTGDCTGAVYQKNFTFPATYINDNNAVLIRIDLYPEVNTFCDPNDNVSATLTYTSGSPPVAEANGPYTVNQGVALTMNSAGSSTSSGTLTLFEWDCTNNGSYDVSNTTGTGLTCTYPDDGPYTAQLRVTNSGGLTATDLAQVNVTNTNPIAEANGPYAGTNGVAIAVSAAGSADGDGSITLYEWDCANDGVFEVSTASTSASCMYATLGSFTAALRITDDDGGTGLDTASVVVSNVLPTAEANGPYSGVESGAVAMSAVGSNDSNGTITLYEWDCTNDGSYESSSPTPGGYSCIYADDGTYTARVRVTDNHGGTSTDTATVTISNLNPVLSGQTVPDGVEGQLLSFEAVAVDPGSADVLSFAWSFGDGGTGSGAIVTHTYADNGVYTVTVTVSDGDGGVTQGTLTSTISNAPPFITAIGGPLSGDEGEELTFPVSAGDPGTADTLSYLWNWGDGTTPATLGATATHPYPSEGTYTVTVTVTDDDGGAATASRTIAIANAPPYVTNLVVNSAPEGSTSTFEATALDPDPSDVLTYSWTFGDGNGATGPTVGHAYADDGDYTVTLIVSDDDLGSVTQTETVTVLNVAPTWLGGTGPLLPVDEGAIEAWTGSAVDPGVNDVIVYDWQWGDGTGSGGSSVTHAYPDEGVYNVTVTTSDGDGGTDIDGFAVPVSNVPPTFLNTPPSIAFEDALYSYLPSVDEPGDDTLTFALAPGAPAAMLLDPATGQLSWTPAYADAVAGTASVTLSVDDGDGGSDSIAFVITVGAADTDGDSMPDGWELENGLDPNDPADGALDPDGDGLDNAEEWAAGSDPGSYDGPSVPELVSPLGGEEAPASPGLTVENASDPQGDPLTYSFEVYGDAALTQLLASATEIAEGAFTTVWTVAFALPENAVAYWRAAASDPHVQSGWSPAESFFVNGTEEAPAAPVLVYPIDGEVAPTSPTLLASLSADPDGDAVTYDLVVYGADGTTEITSASALAGSAADVAWAVDAVLTEDGVYAWTARAVDDGGLASDWAELAFFIASDANDPPDGVVIVSPEDGASVDTVQPQIAASAGDDPEGTELSYFFEVDIAASFDSAEYASQTVPGGADPVLWTLSGSGVSLPENVWAFARVQAIDADGLASVPDTITFFVRGPNDAPDAPVLLRPENAAEGDVTVLFAGTPADPEGDAVSIEFAIGRDSGLGVAVYESGPVLAAGEPGTGETGWSLPEPLSDGTYFWSARASDDRGGVSDWAVPFSFTISGAGGGGGCEDCPNGDPAGGEAAASLLLVSALVGRRRRR